MSLDAVIFDCDGVLIDSEVICLAVELECLAELGLHYDRDAYAARYLGTMDIEFIGGLNDDHHQRFGKPLPDTFTEQMSDRIWARINTDLTIIAGVHDFAAALHLPKAIASGSSTAGLERKPRQVGLFETFAPHIYSAQLVARGKPAPDVFLHAAQAIGVAPENSLAVEDSVNGVTAARAAGMRVIGFTGGGHCTPGHGARLRAAGAEHVVEYMDHLLAVLGRMS